MGPDPSLDAIETDRPVAVEFYSRAAAEVARDLLGTCLVSTVGGDDKVCAGVVVETEAYGGPEDPASHAATATGITDRNRAMYGPPGRAYVYRSYGVHWCLNVVTGRDGQGEAVLLRGLLPVHGLDVMLERRGRRPLAEGPGRLARAMGVT
ncbi:MAG: DNA-3-methyladenine glycosylase, partial [Gemmatimonadetes bacterium]|nr:DNA-3-methyladenine glycosylase [Gemmatimonadota bacterium]